MVPTKRVTPYSYPMGHHSHSFVIKNRRKWFKTSLSFYFIHKSVLWANKWCSIILWYHRRCLLHSWPYIVTLWATIARVGSWAWRSGGILLATGLKEPGPSILCFKKLVIKKKLNFGPVSRRICDMVCFGIMRCFSSPSSYWKHMYFSSSNFRYLHMSKFDSVKSVNYVQWRI
jgi:hypothetical protein